MKNGYTMIRTIGIAVFMLSAGFVFLYAFVEEVSATTLTVDNTGGGMFLSIRSALSSAVSGDTIIVAYGTGTYNEDTSTTPLSFNFPLNIIGQMNGQGQLPSVVGSNPASHVFELGPQAFPALIEWVLTIQW